ncbi:GntR family transcriptional regulator [Streptomyces sp. TLI_146]|uniref:GntR family transcriptional regulator n=1 Tax=Streptomyces sp. TLI_146 TaxID=1938858 RepID=UPI000C7070F8|nr:GntR family transcriptional regulator [Streptomyces sp. TLI_146]PKV84222.1 regulatory GntR family protein [Streptomyces sp. TLI_146]
MTRGGVRPVSATDLSNTGHVLLTRIARGDHFFGSALPLPADLAAELRVPEICVRSALDRLHDLGVLDRDAGHRLVVASRERWKVRHAEPGPGAVAAARQLRGEIRDGVHRVGHPLPPGRDLVRLLGLSPRDVRRALRDLAAEGLLALPVKGNAIVISSHPTPVPPAELLNPGMDGASC